ncbi:hypothetical protein F5Y17DRAFT_225928 [Xylariaceae sp. FL0594]|nr:hypothetical protein F5Y17DRAFT_225928 [Xylariaceae sp. FL0594]
MTRSAVRFRVEAVAFCALFIFCPPSILSFSSFFLKKNLLQHIPTPSKGQCLFLIYGTPIYPGSHLPLSWGSTVCLGYPTALREVFEKGEGR